MKQGDTGLVQALRRIVGDLAALPVETSVAVAHIAAALQDVLQQHTEIPAQLLAIPAATQSRRAQRSVRHFVGVADMKISIQPADRLII